MSVIVTVSATGFALSAIAQAIKTLYQIGAAIDEYIDEHIDALKRSGTPVVASTGRVLEAAKFGFGLGYISWITIVAAGQYLMGNTLGAMTTVVTGVTLTNPMAMTCAAVGAIYYGWNALTEKERVGILEQLRVGLEVGAELIRAIIEFVIRTMKELLTSKQLVEIKEYIKTQAALFGRSLYDVTQNVSDFVGGVAERAGELAGGAYGAAAGAVTGAAGVAVRISASIGDVVDTGLVKANKAMGRKAKKPVPADEHSPKKSSD